MDPASKTPPAPLVAETARGEARDPARDGAGPPRVSGEQAETGSARRSRVRPSAAEWLLLAYLTVVACASVLDAILGHDVRHALASNPDDVAAAARLWSLVTSGLVAHGPLVPQLVLLAALGVAAIRLAGGRMFWSAAVLAHVLGTLLVYAGVWIADIAGPSASGLLHSEADFGVSLVWCAALGVLAGVAWWHTRPLPRWLWRMLAVGAPAVMVAVLLASGGLAFYEHAVAFVLAAGLVFAAQRSASIGRALRLLRSTPGDAGCGGRAPV